MVRVRTVQYRPTVNSFSVSMSKPVRTVRPVLILTCTAYVNISTNSFPEAALVQTCKTKIQEIAANLNFGLLGLENACSNTASGKHFRFTILYSAHTQKAFAYMSPVEKIVLCGYRRFGNIGGLRKLMDTFESLTMNYFS